MHLSEGRGDGQKKRRAPTSNKPRHNHNRSERGGAGKAEEDRSGVGRTYCFRIAIVKLSGVQWGTWIIIDEYLSVVILSTPTTHASWCRGKTTPHRAKGLCCHETT